jgi:predicted lipoprotein with Yx(FWY)xxD motif
MRGGVLTDAYSHKTLYTFDKDSTTPPRSACNAECTVKWPPFRPSAGERDIRDFTIIKRDDGSPQWAYMGKPLYTFVGDTARRREPATPGRGGSFACSTATAFAACVSARRTLDGFAPPPRHGAAVSCTAVSRRAADEQRPRVRKCRKTSPPYGAHLVVGALANRLQLRQDFRARARHRTRSD